jgi:hypothetical protein
MDLPSQILVSWFHGTSFDLHFIENGTFVLSSLWPVTLLIIWTIHMWNVLAFSPTLAPNITQIVLNYYLLIYLLHKLTCKRP